MDRPAEPKEITDGAGVNGRKLCAAYVLDLLVFDDLPIAYIELDPELRVTAWNSEAKHVFGYSKVEVAGRDCVELLVPEQARAAAAREWAALIEEAPSLREPMPNVTRDGKPIWCRWKARVARDAAGNIERIIAVVDEVTEQHDALVALHASEERFRLLIEQAPVPIGIHREGKGVYANPAHRKLFGYASTDDVVGKPVFDFVAPESRQVVIDRMRRRSDGARIGSSYEMVGLRADGSRFPVSTDILNVELADGPAVVVFHSDLTEAHRARAEIQRKELRWRTVLNAVGVAVLIERRDGCITGGNIMAQAILGFPDAVFLGQGTWQPDWALVSENGELLSESEYPARRVFESGVAHHDIIVGLRSARHHDLRWYVVHADPVPVAEGAFDEVIVALLDITELKTAERILQESQERFRVAFDHAGIGMAIIDQQGRPVLSNAALQAMLGRSGDELALMSFSEFTHPDDTALDVALFQEILEGKRPKYALEKRYVHSDGHIVWGRLTATIVRGHQGEPRYGIGMVEDITEQKHAETELQASQELNRQIVETAAEGIWAIDSRERTIYVNHRMCEMLGYNEQELRTRPARDFMFHRIDDFEHHMGERKQGRASLRETVFRRKDGRELWVSISGAPLQDREGNFEGSFGMFTDITDRKRAEDALRESEERFRAVLEQAAVGFSVVEIDGSIIEWNRAIERMTGIPRAQALGNKIWDVQLRLMRPELRTEQHRLDWQRSFERSATTGEVIHGSTPIEVELHLPDGRRCNLLQIVYPIRVEGGFRFGHVVWDVTEAKRAEEANRRAEAQLRQAQKMEALGTLAGGVAHDFNNILAAIVGFTQVVYDDMDTQSDSREDLAQVLKACERAKNLVQQILSFSRRGSQERRPTDVGPIVREAAQLLRSTLPAAVRVDVEVADNLPTVLADPTQMHQVIMNLCTNAAHAMRARPGALRLRLDEVILDAQFTKRHPVLHPGQHLRITVQDSGHGMDPNTLARIFEPFFTTKAPGEGTGLGLSVVHGIIAEHAGAIVVNSEVERGTSFELFLPALRDKALEREVTFASQPLGNHERILVVDDEPPLSALLKRLLTRLRYDPLVVTDPRRALELLRANPGEFALVITDLNMPGMTGIELASAIVQLRADLPIILSTGYHAGYTPQQMRDFGVFSVLDKPYTSQQVGEHVSLALSTARSRMLQ